MLLTAFCILLVFTLRWGCYLLALFMVIRGPLLMSKYNTETVTAKSARPSADRYIYLNTLHCDKLGISDCTGVYVQYM